MSQILKRRCKATSRWLLDLENTSLEQNLRLKNLGYFSLSLLFFFICCVAATWPTFGYYWGNSLPHLMIITAFRQSFFGPIVTRRGWLSTSNWSQWHNPLSHSPQIEENTLPRLEPRFPKCGNAPNTQNSYSLTLGWPLGLHNTSLDANM